MSAVIEEKEVVCFFAVTRSRTPSSYVENVLVKLTNPSSRYSRGFDCCVKIPSEISRCYVTNNLSVPLDRKMKRLFLGLIILSCVPCTSGNEMR